jgi:hypothetical protein
MNPSEDPKDAAAYDVTGRDLRHANGDRGDDDRIVPIGASWRPD